MNDHDQLTQARHTIRDLRAENRRLHTLLARARALIDPEPYRAHPNWRTHRDQLVTDIDSETTQR